MYLPLLYTLAYSVSLFCTDGALDPLFADNGILIDSRIITNGDDILSGLFIQDDKKIVIAGTQLHPTRGYVARYTDAGRADTTFNPTGANPGIVDVPTAQFLANVLVQPDGKIIICGTDATGTQFFTHRLNTDGSTDLTFNSGVPQISTFTSSQQAEASGIALDTNNSIIIVGQTIDTTQASSGVIIRYTPTGLLDTTLNGSGVITFRTTVGGSPVNTTFFSVALQLDHSIVVAGTATDLPNALIARFTPTGILDTSFGSGPQPGVIIDPFGDIGFFEDIIIQPNGDLLLAHTITSGAPTMGARISRLQPNGSPDSSFNGTGSTDILVVPEPGLAVVGTKLGLARDGKILLGGTVLNNNGSPLEFILARYTIDGHLDTSFGSPNGFVITMPFNQQSAGVKIALDQDGFITQSGIIASPPQVFLGVLRYQSSSPLAQTTIIDPVETLTGSAQSKSIVVVFQGTTLIYTAQSVTDIWSCTGTVSGSEPFRAVAHYPAGAVNISSCFATFPETAINTAIRLKYCVC